ALSQIIRTFSAHAILNYLTQRGLAHVEKRTPLMGSRLDYGLAIGTHVTPSNAVAKAMAATISTRHRAMPSGTHIAEEAGGLISSRTGGSCSTSSIHAAIPFRISCAKLCGVWRRSAEATTSFRKTS